MIRRKCYEELGKRCVVKTESQEVFKKYTGIFAISSKGVIGYDVYKKGGIDSNRMVDFINKFINGKYKNKLLLDEKMYQQTILGVFIFNTKQLL